MIHEIGLELGSALRAKGCPYPVVDGPEELKSASLASRRIVIEYDDGGDRVALVRSQHKNPKHVATLTLGAKITIYAQSTRAGAAVFEHRRQAHAVLRPVIVALSHILQRRKNPLTVTGGKFVTPADLAGSEVLGGAVYELKFTFDTGVPDVTFAGDAGPEATLGVDGIRNTTRVAGAHGPDDDDDPNTFPASAETACGS